MAMSRFAAALRRPLDASPTASLSPATPFRFAAASRRLLADAAAGGGDSNDPATSSAGEGTSMHDSFFQSSSEGLVYGRLTTFGRSVMGKNTLKTDIIHYLDERELSVNDVKFDYNRAFVPMGALLQFPSRSSFDAAVRQTIKKGRLYKIEKIDRSEWDLKQTFDGKAVLLEGIPRNALLEDIERFLSGTNYDPSTFETFFRQGFPENIKLVLVKFPTKIDAMNAFCSKNRNFCLNSPVSMLVLQ